MKPFGPLAKAVALVGIILGLAAVPSFAGDAENQLLDEFIGEWRGNGQMTGARTDPVTCRLTMTSANQAKVNFVGRCSFAGAQLGVRGTVGFIDASNRYEASMTATPGSYKGRAVGRKVGNSIVFDLKDRNVDNGSAYDIASSMILKDSKINVTFKVTFVDSGESISAQIPFERKS